jgi:hypothetical protein
MKNFFLLKNKIKEDFFFLFFLGVGGEWWTHIMLPCKRWLMSSTPKKKKKPYTSVSSLVEFTYISGSQFRPTTTQKHHAEHIADKLGSHNPLASWANVNKINKKELQARRGVSGGYHQIIRILAHAGQMLSIHENSSFSLMEKGTLHNNVFFVRLFFGALSYTTSEWNKLFYTFSLC